ncbi:Activator of Hsp90 ATPase homolog 1-like protein [Chitinophaga arvensicola]|uniref:Activator of Hsp90 ATPase homolog 1-like protein n=2 Tax=Chitinophaga arvensicola TaxID=29529 RepID=A0A1I0QWE5_9BACT|nr:Activator of Hsp90 ATPase homolog 1-like protein [Chitinophaga arvensicola]
MIITAEAHLKYRSLLSSFYICQYLGFSYLSIKNMTSGKIAIGPTASQGWETGIRRTFNVAPDQAWELVFTQPILGAWLDNKADIAFEKGDTYTTASGITIHVTSVTTGKVIRMKWQQAPDTNISTLQIRVIPNKGKTTIAFHQEWLKDARERTDRNTAWKKVLDTIGEFIG